MHKNDQQRASESSMLGSAFMLLPNEGFQPFFVLQVHRESIVQVGFSACQSVCGHMDDVTFVGVRGDLCAVSLLVWQ